MRILDCTLRDGANVVGLGFDREQTTVMLRGLLESGIREIEFGNAHGIGCNEPGSVLTDAEYLELFQPFRGQAHFGMFLQAHKASEAVIRHAAAQGLDFLRVGNIAGKGHSSLEAVKRVKENGLECRYSIMRAYIGSEEEIAAECSMLAENGVDEVTLMDSAGTMLPEEVKRYILRAREAAPIPVGFHGHNNLGLAMGNALAAIEAGADCIDTGLMGMARSAGNCATEIAAAVLEKKEIPTGIRLYRLLSFIRDELMPMMEKAYRNPVPPMDLLYGFSGCHSNVAPRIEKIAAQRGVSAYELIKKVCEVDLISPSEELIRQIAEDMK